jgi:hypothetical protein
MVAREARKVAGGLPKRREDAAKVAAVARNSRRVGRHRWDLRMGEVYALALEVLPIRRVKVLSLWSFPAVAIRIVLTQFDDMPSTF